MTRITKWSLHNSLHQKSFQCLLAQVTNEIKVMLHHVLYITIWIKRNGNSSPQKLNVLPLSTNLSSPSQKRLNRYIQLTECGIKFQRLSCRLQKLLFLSTMVHLPEEMMTTSHLHSSKPIIRCATSQKYS